jgi:membrane-associated protease RseP (regulator of RpoE activity)
MTIRYLLALLIAICVNANAQTQPNAGSGSTEFADRMKCLIAEDEAVARNKTVFDSLYRSAMDKYDGAQPCIGTGAHNEHGLNTSICGKAPPHFTVGEVESKSGADLAGLLQGDILVAVEDKPIRYRLDLEVAVLASKPGSKIALTVQRGQNQIQREVLVGLMPVKPGVPLRCTLQP